MPDTDLDAELARLRDDVRGALPVPGFEQVVARHKQRVVRRRMQIGAVVAVLVVSLAVPLLRGQLAARPPAPPVGTSMPTGTYFTSINFFDGEHGYAIRRTCEGEPVECGYELLATSDGEHWDKRPLPRPESAPSWVSGQINVLGPEELTVDWPLSAASEVARYHRMHSTDGGRTWDDVGLPLIVTDTVEEIPEDGVLVASCAKLVGGGQKCSERGFAVLLPGSGRSAVLANPPPLTAMLAGSDPTFDGTWWVAGRDPRTERWGLAVSHDDGRTWTTTVLNWESAVDSYGWSVVSQGGTLYATAIGALPDTSNGLLRILRSTDRGRTWEQTWQPAEGKQPRRVFSSTIAAADGTLTINGPDGMYASRDGGRTFTKAPQRYPGYAGQARNGYLAVSNTERDHVEVSDDGVRWRRIEIG